MSDNWYTEGFLNPDVQNNVKDQEAIGQSADVLALNIPDDDLVDIIDKRIEDTRLFYQNKYDLYNRRKKNEKYYFGRQIQEAVEQGRMKDYEAKNLDNVLYEIEATIKPLAMTQLPDLLVTPGNNSDSSRQASELLTTIVDSDVKKRENRRVLGLAFKHLPVYYVGVIKIRWNPELAGGLGDYEFIVCHPDTIDFDYTVTEPDADKMSYVSHLVQTNVEKVLMQFPKHKEEFIDQLRRDGIVAKQASEPDWKALATPIEIREVWFTDYEKAEDGEWRRVEGVCWKYKSVLLDKMKNPYFDYEGEEKAFTYDDPSLESSRRELTMDEMQMSMMTGMTPPNVQFDQVYHNYFQMPRKPFFFMVYDQWGKQPLDETSRIEQNIRNQATLDKRGKQIEETLDNRGHHVWSKMSGLKPSDVQRMDHNNPDEDYLVEGNVRDVHEFINPERPTQQEFADLDRTRDRMYAISGSQAVRGELDSDTATTNQIAREANYTRADDLVDDTINPASEWMAGWALQMIKTRYTQEHFRKVLGDKGEVIYVKLHQDMVQDGMEVMIKSSGTDKIKKQNNAMEMAQLKLIDPLTFYQDMQMDDPEGRTARLIAYTSSPPLYIGAFVSTGPTATPELAQKLMAITGQQQMMMQPQQPGMPPPQGMQGMPQQPTPTNTAQVPAMPQAAPPQASPRMI